MHYIAHHIKNFDSYAPKNGVKVAHNRENFTQALNDNNLQVTNEIQGSKGLSEVYYGREKVNGRGEPDGFKTYKEPKTIYDPKIYSDEQILQIGKKAVVTGYDDAMEKFTVSNGKINAYSVEVEGIKFRAYLDKQTGELSNFNPTLKD